MGFDRVWAVEHHSLKWYAHMRAPEVFLTWVAAKTERIRMEIPVRPSSTATFDSPTRSLVIALAAAPKFTR